MTYLVCTDFTREGLESTDEDHEAMWKHLESARQELEASRLGLKELKRKLAAVVPIVGDKLACN